MLFEVVVNCDVFIDLSVGGLWIYATETVLQRKLCKSNAHLSKAKARSQEISDLDILATDHGFVDVIRNSLVTHCVS